MYQLIKSIPNTGPLSLILEACFHPSGRYFAVTYGDINEVRLYDTDSLEVLRVFKNPSAELDHPHGVLLTENHLIVSMSHERDRPSLINVYRLDRAESEPITVFKTPLPELCEGHCLAYNAGRLLVTYCEGPLQKGTLVSYAFDDESGQFNGLVDYRKDCFENLGDTKGLTFFDNGSKVLVSFNSAKRKPLDGQPKRTPIRSATKLLFRNNPLRFLQKAQRKLSKRLEPQRTTENGLAIFAIDGDGKFSPEPLDIILRSDFCRYENVLCEGAYCFVTDLVNQEVLIYNVEQDPKLETPIDRLPVSNALPHGVSLSPDGQRLVVTTFSLEINERLEIQWDTWREPRQDRLLIFSPSDAPAAVAAS